MYMYRKQTNVVREFLRAFVVLLVALSAHHRGCKWVGIKRGTLPLAIRRSIIRNLNALYQTVELTGEKLDMLIQRLTQLQQSLQSVV